MGREGMAKPVVRLKEAPRVGERPSTPSSSRGSPSTANRRLRSSVTLWKLAVSFSSWICNQAHVCCRHCHVQLRAVAVHAPYQPSCPGNQRITDP